MLNVCTHSDIVLRVNAELGRDPTRTTTLRNQFMAEIARRLAQIKRDINTSIIDNDAFGFTPLTTNDAIPVREFAFDTNPEKIINFRGWMLEQVFNELLSVNASPFGDFRNRLPIDVGDQWTDVWVDRGYMRGIGRAQSELKKAGIQIPDDSIAASLNSPIHIQTLQELHTRTFDTLVNFGETLASEVSAELANVLTEGLALGLNPREIARNLTNKITALNNSRARTIARTEIIRAHHLGNIAEYERFQVQGVTILAEFSTAGDDRVCPRCETLEENNPYTLEQVRDLIPVHPNCRCTAIPIVGPELVEAINKRGPNLGTLN